MLKYILTKFVCFISILSFLTMASCAKTNVQSEPVSYGDNIVSDILSATTTVGGRKKHYSINGESKPATIGTPFTMEEIQNAIDLQKHLVLSDFGDNCEIAVGGYYSINLDNMLVDYNFFEMPIFIDDNVVGAIFITRFENGEISSSSGEENSFINLFNDYPEDEYIMLYSATSKMAITPDNKVHILYGQDTFSIINDETLYESFKTIDSVIFSKNARKVSINI